MSSAEVKKIFFSVMCGTVAIYYGGREEEFTVLSDESSIGYSYRRNQISTVIGVL